MAQDTVCKMSVDENSAAATTTYKGETFFFCAAGSKKAFEKEPEKYIKKE